MGKSFDAFRKILREQKLDSYFRESYCGQYLDLSEYNNARFPMKMAWAFEVIPYLRQQVNYQEEVSFPRILRWLSAKTDKNANFLNLFNPPKEAHIDVIFYYLRKKAKLQTQEQYRYTIGNCLYKVYINNAYDRYCQQKPEVSQKEKCLINIIKGFCIPAGLPWHLVDEVYILINYGDEIHWVLAVVIPKKRRIQVYNSMSRRKRFGPSTEIQKLAKILPTYLDISGFLDQKVHTDWSTIEDTGIKWLIHLMDCSSFIIAYAEYLSDELQVPNDILDAGLLLKRYAALLWKYGEAKAQNPYATTLKIHDDQNRIS
ncbi:hypothetical protein BC332_26343 [Capsicum chinense]|nr:hypothetical protein BC332_26343 [Capsicum chinense]